MPVEPVVDRVVVAGSTRAKPPPAPAGAVESPRSLLASTLAETRRTAAALRGAGRGSILAAVSLGWGLSMGIRLAFPPLLPAIREALGLDLTTAGLLITLLWLAYAVGQLPGGILADRFGERNVLVASATLGLLTIGLVVTSVGLGPLLVGTVLFGLATGLYAPTRFTMVTDIYPDRGATAMGVISAAGNLGASLLPVGAGLVAATLGWRAGLGVWTPAFVITAVWLFRVVPRRTSERAGVGAPATTTRRVLGAVTRPAVRRGTLQMLFMEIVFLSFTGFYPTYLVAVKGLGTGTAATVYGIFFATGIVVQPVAGAVGDRFGPRYTMAAAAAFTVATLAALPAVNGVVPLALLTVLITAQMGFWPIAQTAVIEALPTAVQGSGFGVIRTAYLLVAAGGPVVVGRIADEGYFETAFLLLAGVAVIPFLLSFGWPSGPVAAVRSEPAGDP